ncbi:MAG: hypothetical protein H7288_06600 [Kineosporiaceae bacterium]|nr:hypothetical protein [Aeromicrobium sp.]
MKNLEIVWRTLADAVLKGQRDWNSIGDIADAASVAPSTTHQALGRLGDIGAVRPKPRRGYTVVSPEKLLEAFAAHRNLRADTMVSTTLPAAQELLDDDEVDYALSGSTAAVHYLGGRNTVADLGRRIVYTSRALSQNDFPAGDEVIILAEDPLAARTWKSGYASLAQTYADLWASPGWQAAEFTRAPEGKAIRGRGLGAANQCLTSTRTRAVSFVLSSTGWVTTSSRRSSSVDGRPSFASAGRSASTSTRPTNPNSAAKCASSRGACRILERALVREMDAAAARRCRPRDRGRGSRPSLHGRH